MAVAGKKPIRTEGRVSSNDIGVACEAGDMVNQRCGVHRPMPCIVILVHGVNDVGEAYQNQDEGICAGLNDRLGRYDLHPHEWKPHEFMISDVDGNISFKTCSISDQNCVGEVNRSPIIPFYWGYKPVDHTTFTADQKRYRDELIKKKQDADLPYDTYQQNDSKIIKKHDNQNLDNLNNWLDPAFAKGGGTFANATTNIPDMFGPGASGAALTVVGAFSRSAMNGGDWSHPIYNNPHRIYQAYAARRLADLIIAIRRNEPSKRDTINIVAHSQGTIITLLANMWVKAEGLEPADCVILNHSPYSLESRKLENVQPGNQQTSQARQKTLANFCKLMATNALYNGGKAHDAAYIKKLDDTTCLHRVNRWGDSRYTRNNFGMVYNYFCPNDQVVSMLPVQGMGWHGVPDKVRSQLGDNFNQRAFCKGAKVGEQTGYHFAMPPASKDDPAIPLQDAKWNFNDITVNAPLLPVSFTFVLQGQNSKNRYQYDLADNDIYISKAAMKAERLISETIDIPNSSQFRYLNDGRRLDPTQIKEIESLSPNNIEVIDARVTGDYNSPLQKITLRRRMTDDELNEALKVPSSYSQHSSIVRSTFAPRMAMVYDLAIGQNKAFENKDFWESLLLQADWRRGDLNPLEKVKIYYKKGILPPEFKQLMNKPELPHGIPTDKEFGVVNDYGPRQRVKPGSKQDSENQMVDVVQWEPPKPLV
ncbi:DUF3274 domain-containing protein [Serratia sp. DD3]|uniref:T6SS effector phospholipase Tle3 domain-containing protein n=1 Tax=Serratia sp. DD3 TaxID=1410619 RepID=UPI0003C51101|nr:DUF3274 domain-containing protein [Serratia sp. DD3]KEY56975.1 hypothetical protein SRDD_42240 [Serratia sp. DD3]